MNNPDPIPLTTRTGRARHRKFGVSDLMVSIGGVALLLTFGKAESVALLQQARGLSLNLAACFGVGPSQGPPEILKSSLANQASSVLWHGFQVASLLVLITTPVFLLIRLG